MPSTLIASWADLCRPGQALAGLVPWGGLSAGQWQLLERINPLQAPVMGLETSRHQRWRRADLALLLLNQQWSRWAKLLEPWLQDGQRLANALPISGLSDVLHFDQCRPETWIELCGELEGGQTPGLMVFKNPLQPWTLEQTRDLCLGFALQQKTSSHGLPATIIDDAWWESLKRIDRLQVHQIGLNLRKQEVEWRLLLEAPTGSCHHLKALGIPECWHDELRSWPHNLALIAGQRLECCGLEILPRYRGSLNLSELQQAPPAGREQWPDFITRTRLLTTQRRLQLEQTTGAHDCACKGAADLMLLSGVNHLKLNLIGGNVLDLKAYAGAFARQPTGREVESAPAARLNPGVPADPLETLQTAVHRHWHQHRHAPWQGFQLNPGVSDRWIATAVLALLANAGNPPWLFRLWQQRCEQLLASLQPLQPIGYSRNTPADADSTIWLQRLLIACNRSNDADLQPFLAAHWQESGIATYRSESGIAQFIGRTPPTCQGWFEPHDCVLANLSALPGALQNKAITLLRRKVHSGAFRSTWWPAPGWALSLAPRGSLPLPAVMDLIQEPLTSAVVNCLGPAAAQSVWEFQHALALLRHGTQQQRRHSAQTIVEMHNDANGFRQLTCLQIPDPAWPGDHRAQSWDLDTGLEKSLNRDQLGHFSAALVGAALK